METHIVGDTPIVDASAPEQAPLAFSLNFISGRGLLSCRERRIGPLELKVMELEIPDIAFPFDVTGGADRFKSHRCVLRHLVMGLDADGLNDFLRTADLPGSGFVEFKVAIRDGFIEFTGRFAVGDHQADFTFRASLLLRSPEEVAVVFYDTRVYGWLPVPASLLPVYLRRAIASPHIHGERAGAWELQPAKQFIRHLLPPYGWKIPNTQRATLVAAEVARGQMILVAGPEGEPNPRQLVEREPPAAAVRAFEGMNNVPEAEVALGRGSINEAYEKFRDTLDDERGGRWAREQLLHIGAADPELALETRQLAEEALAEDPKDVPALLALAAIAIRERSWGDAAGRYAALADIARDRKGRYDLVAAELAAAAAAAPIDPAGALAAYERAAARARDSLVAHRALFELRHAQGDWDGAARAGERLVKLDPDPENCAGVHRQLGQLYRMQLHDLKRARLHFERGLRLTPDDPEGLEGLAETYAARGEPGRAASYLARLADQAEESGDRKRIIGLNLRLGDIWERWLGDRDSAQSRYHRVLDVDPKNRTARLRLAELAEARGELARARALYEDVLAAEEDTGDPAAIPDLVAAYTRLARVTLSAEGASAEAIACLERAVELDPGNRTARDELVRLLRDRGEWGRLIHLLEEAARITTNTEEARRSRLAAASLELDQRQNRAAAQRHLELVLDAMPDDPEALGLLVPILETQRKPAVMARRLSAAAEATSEPEHRASFLFQLTRAQQGASERRATLEAALDANPYHSGAAAALVELAEKMAEEQGGVDRLVHALGRLAVAAEQAADRAGALIKQGRVLLEKMDRPQEAEETLREAVSLWPSSSQAVVFLSTVLENRGQPDNARATLESALRQHALRDFDRGLVHQRLAELAAKRGDAETQVRQLHKALESGIDTEELRDALVHGLTILGQQVRVAELYDEWLAEGDPDERSGLLLKNAALRKELGQPDRARACYRDLVELGGEAAQKGAAALEEMAREEGDEEAAAEAIRIQISLAHGPARATLMERLLLALINLESMEEAETTARLLLREEPDSVPAHRYLSGRAEVHGEFSDALAHLEHILFESPRDKLTRIERGLVFKRAGAIAAEIKPDTFATLQTTYDQEFPEAPPGALKTPLGDMLREAERWESLAALRSKQLESVRGLQALSYHQELADILHHRLGRSGEAVIHYQEVMGTDPSNVQARDTVIQLYSQLERWRDLADLLFALGELAGDEAESVSFALRSAELYATKVGDVEAAQQVLQVVSNRAGATDQSDALAAALRVAQMHAELAQVLEQVVSADPNPDDERFAELLHVLAGPIGDPLRATAWCMRMVEAFPDSDRPRRLFVDLQSTSGAFEDTLNALRTWADARQGSLRASVLLELGERLHVSGDQEQAIAVLTEAAAADPHSEAVIQQLIDRHTTRSDFAQVVHWTKQLADAAEPGPARDERMRRLIQVANDYADDVEAAAHGLENLDARTVDETRMLVRSFLDRGNVHGLERLAKLTNEMGEDISLPAAELLTEAGALDAARSYWGRCLLLGDAQEVWDRAAVVWRQHGHLRELGLWRIELAERASVEEELRLKLLGFAELVEAGDDLAEACQRVDIDAQLHLADLNAPDSAWAVLTAARAARFTEWVSRAARKLEDKLPDADPRLVAVLKVRVEEELGGGNPQEAVALAQRLAVLSDPEADRWLDTALIKAGRVKEVLDRLTERAELGAEDAPAVWTRIAGLQAERGESIEAAKALAKVAAGQRSDRWGELAYQIGGTLKKPKLQTAGAILRGRICDDTNERALWLRIAGHLLWRRLDKDEDGRTLLREAQEISPLASDVLCKAASDHLSADALDEARWALEEGLVVLKGADSAGALILLSHTDERRGDLEAAKSHIQSAEKQMPEDGHQWGQLAQQAERLNEGQMALNAYARAYAVDVAWESDYVAALEGAEQWITLIAVLQQRGEQLLEAGESQEAATHLERAAELLTQTGGDAAVALVLLQQAVKAAPSLSNMLAAFDLAAQLERAPVVAALGPPLLEQLPGTTAQRGVALRRFVDALDHLGLEEESAAPRRELVERSEATARDKLRLGRFLRESEPQTAASLLQEAAAAPEHQSTPEVFLEAAQAWHALGDDDRARPLLEQGLANDVDALEAHELGMALLTDAKRMRCMQRFVELQGDTSWQPEQKARLRLELAPVLLDLGEGEHALELLLEAKNLHRLPGWAIAMEKVLRALDRRHELAQLYLDEATTPKPDWTGQNLVERLRKAASEYRKAAILDQELRALSAIRRLAPDDKEAGERLVAVAAELGDKDLYLDEAKEQLRALRTAEERASLALSHGQVLCDHFEDTEGAVTLWQPAFVEAPNCELGLLLANALVSLNRRPEAIAALGSAGGSLETADGVGLLAKAAELSESAIPPDEAQAFSMYRQIMLRDASVEKARNFCFGYAERNEEWAILVELLEGSAKIAADPREGHDLLIRAADVVRDRLHDSDGEISLIRSALEIFPDRDGSVRIYRLCLERGELDTAAEMLLKGQVMGEGCLELALELASRFQATGRAETRAKVMDWVAESYPEAAESSEYRLERARSQQDHASILTEVRQCLESKRLATGDRAAFHAEAGTSAAALGEHRVALDHFLEALRGDQPVASVLLDASDLARELGDESSQEAIIDSAVKMRADLFSRAARAKGDERVPWLTLLGQAHQAANDETAAAQAFQQAIDSAEEERPRRAEEALGTLYTKSGDWKRLVQLLESMAEREERGLARAELLLRAANIWKDSLLEESKAEALYKQSLEADDTFAPTQAAYGSLLASQHRFEDALPYLRSSVDMSSTDPGALAALAECLQHAGEHEPALQVIDRVLGLDSTRHDARARRAALLDALQRRQEATAEWRQYLDAVPQADVDDSMVPVYRRVADAMAQAGDLDAAITFLEGAYQLQPDVDGLVTELRSLYERSGRWNEVVEMRHREAELATDAATQMQHFQALAAVYGDQLSDAPKAATMLERAAELNPTNADVQRQLLDLCARIGDWTKFLVVGERLMVLLPEEELDAKFFIGMAEVFHNVAGDPDQAKHFYGKAVEKDPANDAVVSVYRNLARESRDFQTYVDIEERAIEHIEDAEEKVRRYQELAEVYLKELTNLQKAAVTLFKARQLRPKDRALLRRLADTYALEKRFYSKAADLYRELLDETPLDGDLLRIAARLAGQMGETDRAYGYYAALSVVAPNDAEAQRFVQACRGARPPGPQRALTDADRTTGLIHPDQRSVFEDLFAPLARFAELTHPGDLAQRGVVDRDQLSPTDLKLERMRRVLDPLGMPQASFYMWRAGGYASEVELLAKPAILLGSMLAGDASDRQRVFLVARAAELYRSGHTLCERLHDSQLLSLMAALSMAVAPEAVPPGLDADSEKWANTVRAPMTAQIRSIMAPKVQSYLQKAAQLEIGVWRQSCLCTANRVAMLLSCDIEEAIASLLQVRGFEDVSDEQRVGLLQEAPEELDLLRFAISEPFFKLRQSLGLALRKSK